MGEWDGGTGSERGGVSPSSLCPSVSHSRAQHTGYNAANRHADMPPEPAVADQFDPYREALVMETNTIWPAEYEDLSAAEKARLEEQAARRCQGLLAARIRPHAHRLLPPDHRHAGRRAAASAAE